jgi:hypothetical protein
VGILHGAICLVLALYALKKRTKNGLSQIPRNTKQHNVFAPKNGEKKTQNEPENQGVRGITRILRKNIFGGQRIRRRRTSTVGAVVGEDKALMLMKRKWLSMLTTECVIVVALHLLAAKWIGTLTTTMRLGKSGVFYATLATAC